ncbi:hypothetical protein D3C75_688540 [compost metagenome]
MRDLRRLNKQAGDLIQFPDLSNTQTSESEKAFNIAADGLKNLVFGITYLDFQLDKLGLINSSQRTKNLISEISYIENELTEIQLNIEKFKKRTPN